MTKGGQEINSTNPPTFNTGVTNKVVYREELRRWIRIFKACEEVHKKYKLVLNSAGHIILRSFEYLSNKLLNQKEKDGTIDMDEAKDGKKGDEIIDTIIGRIAKHTL